MTTTLNLPIEKGVAERIKKYAANRKVSVSSMVERYFTLVTAMPLENSEQEISPLIKSFSIENVNVPADFDYKKELANARDDKYVL